MTDMIVFQNFKRCLFFLIMGVITTSQAMYSFLPQKNVTKAPYLEVKNGQMFKIIIKEFNRTVGSLCMSEQHVLQYEDKVRLPEKNKAWLYDMYITYNGELCYIGSLSKPGNYTIVPVFYTTNETGGVSAVEVRHCFECKDEKSCENCFLCARIFYRKNSKTIRFSPFLYEKEPKTSGF